MRKIVIVDLAGGIGNQIFLIEIANFISSIDNRIIMVNKSNIDKKHSGGKSTIEDFVLLNHIKLFQFNKLINKFYIKFGLFIKTFNWFRQSFFLVLDENYNSGSCKDIRDLIVKRNPKIILLTGFWQNFTYWTGNIDYELKVEGPKFKELLSEMKAQDPIIFHYRLGRIDGRWEQPWGVLSPKFLLNALDSLKLNEFTEKAVWIFSNDMSEAKILIGEMDFAPNKIVFINDLELLPAEIMLLLSKANTLICSNSTFSIVAAKIGNIKNVLVPSVLSMNGQNPITLPFEWNKVKSVWLDN
jgi:hypothetical protein